MKKIIKGLGIIGVLLIIIVICTGCSRRPSNAKFIAEGIKLYEQEFNDEFSFVRQIRGGGGPWGEFGTLEEGRMDIIATSKKYPNKEITMSFWCNKNTKEYRIGYTDYNFIRYEQQIYEDLEKVSKIYSDCCVRAKARTSAAIDYDYKDYISATYNGIYMLIYVAPSVQYDKNEDIKRICNILKDNKLNIRSFNIYYLKSNEEYAKIKGDNEFKSGIYGDSCEFVGVDLDENYQVYESWN